MRTASRSASDAMVRSLANGTPRKSSPRAAIDRFRRSTFYGRRAAVPAAALVHIADADAFRPTVCAARCHGGHQGRCADEPLPLFAAAAAREGGTVPDPEPAVALRPRRPAVRSSRTRPVGLRCGSSLSFLRADLVPGASSPAPKAMGRASGRWLEAAGSFLCGRCRQRQGVMFVTLETRAASPICDLPQVFEHTAASWSAGMLSVSGRIQREGEVVISWRAIVRPFGRARQRRRARRRFPLAAWPRRRAASRQSDSRSARPAEGPAAAKYRRPLRAYRPDSSEDAGFSVTSDGITAGFGRLTERIGVAHGRDRRAYDLSKKQDRQTYVGPSFRRTTARGSASRTSISTAAWATNYAIVKDEVVLRTTPAAGFRSKATFLEDDRSFQTVTIRNSPGAGAPANISVSFPVKSPPFSIPCRTSSASISQ